MKVMQVSMHRVFQSFIEALADGVDEASLRAALGQIAEAFDFPLFAYFSLPSAADHPARLVSNYPATWTSEYLERGYERLDPVIAAARAGPEPFIWSRRRCIRELSAAQRRFFDDAERFGIRHGLTLPVHAPDIAVAAVTLVSDRRGRELQSTADRHGRLLQLIAIYFHRHARRLLGGERTLNGVVLTPREFECLSWAARGKSARDIGGVLGIGRRTAAFHLDNARAKLDVRTVAQAVAQLAAAKPKD